jgi:sugar lactone lactonase YvrE
MASARRLLALAATLVLAGVACATTTSTTAPASTTAPSPIPVYTLDRAEHRRPAAVDWHAESRTFFVSTLNDGGIYRGRLDEPVTPIFLRGQPGLSADGIRVVGGRIYVGGGIDGEIRIYDLATRQRTGTFETGAGGQVTDLAVTGSGDVYVTDGVRPVLWHLTPQQVDAGSGTPEAIPVTPEISMHGSCNLNGIVALTDRRLIVANFANGSLYRVDLDEAGGRAIVPITGVTVPLAAGMALDEDRLVVADDAGLSVVALGDDVASAMLVEQIRDPSFRDTAAVALADDRYLVVNLDQSSSHKTPGQPDTVSSVPARS